MNNTKRPMLLVGLIITTFEITFYIISQLISKTDDAIANVIFAVCIIMLIFNVKSFYTVNLTAKEFKKKMYLPWTSFGLTIIYSFFILIVIIMNSKSGNDSKNVLMIANLFIISLGALLYIPGILKKIIDDKLTYEEHINSKKSK